MSIDPSVIEAFVNKHTAAAPFSGVVVVKERGQTIFAQASGFANRSDAVPNILATRFGTASGSKTFTAVAICQLVARGLLTFDTLLATCLHDPLPSFDPGVTIHQLLTHTSGIPDYFDEETMSDFAALWDDLPVYRLRSPADFLPLFQTRPMMFAPGARFHYNNAGFVVLALVVEHVTGMRFHDYMTEHVFRAGGMLDSGYFATDRLPARTALGYIEDAPGTESQTNIFAIPIIGGGDGGAYVTAADVSAFWTALHSNTLLPSELTQMLLTPYVQVREQTYYGYGNWITVDSNGVPFKYRLSGSDPGVTFYTSCYPERDVQIIAIGNSSGGAAAIGKALEQLIDMRQE
jgi:CubicO group peptidase (beta-lactamase class C family)